MGLARSEESARKLEERGIRAVRGDITDAGSVREAAREAEAVVHAALMHAQEIYRAAFNSAEEQYDEESRRHRVAWGAVEQKYEKNEEGKWVEKEEG